MQAEAADVSARVGSSAGSSYGRPRATLPEGRGGGKDDVTSFMRVEGLGAQVCVAFTWDSSWASADVQTAKHLTEGRGLGYQVDMKLRTFRLRST